MLTQQVFSNSTIFVGVDTHKHSHTAVIVDINGGKLSTLKIDTSIKGYRQLVDWAESHGHIGLFGVEGSGCYGAGIERHLTASDYSVVENLTGLTVNIDAAMAKQTNPTL